MSLLSNPHLLLEIDGYTDAAAYETKRYSMKGRQGYRSKSTDTPPNALYLDRIISAGVISRSMFRDGASLVSANPQADVGAAIVELANFGDLDSVFSDPATINFQSRPMRLLMVEPDAALSTAETVIRAVTSIVEPKTDRVVINGTDRLYELRTPHLSATYGGTNALPAGVDGGPELTGKPIPRLWGKAFHIPAPCVNTTRGIYQVSGAAILTVDAAYDKGAPYTQGADYTSQADMETNAPSSGQYRAWPAGGMLRVGGSLPTAFTCDATADSTANSKAGTLLKRLAMERGIDASDVSASQVTALDTANGAVLGIWVNDLRSTLDIMDAVARTVGAAYGFDRLGVLGMKRIEEPAGDPVVVIAPWNESVLESDPSSDEAPTTKVLIRYARYYRPLAGPEVDVTVSAADRADLGEEWRVAEDGSTPSPNPYARTATLELDTLFAHEADAAAEAARRAALLGVPHRMHWARGVQLDDATLLDVDIGSVVELRWDRYGFSREAGTLRRVFAYTKNLAAGTADLLLWGQ
ncbi:MAG TPA: hypothetical protein VEC57_14495 [Candidatus Limnocylindrales bacterium]|nr:hypothetical protein [Candidatus Limnocylindrales bacterium]